MKLTEVKESYQYYSGKQSEIIRQLGFAGIAISWVFKQDIAGTQIIPNKLLWASALIVAALAFDLLQYVAGSLAWGIYHWAKDADGLDPEGDVKPFGIINYPTLITFWIKTILMVTAYGFILTELMSRFL